MDKSELLKQLRIDREAPKPPRRLPWVWVALVLAALGMAAWWALGVRGDKPIPVQTVRVALQTHTDASILDATGYVVARRQATVSAKITGKIAEVLIEEGQRVEENQVLARLDDTDARAQVELAQAQLLAARSQLNDLRIQLAQAERERKRQEELVARKLTSVQAAEQARSAVDSLKARLSALDLAVTVAEKTLHVARVNLDNTVVRAPFAGVVVAKTAQPGEVVSPMSAGGFTRTGIGTIVDMDSLEIEVDVNESFIGRVRPGQPIEARLNAYPDWAIPGEVIAIIPTADRSKATVKVRIAIKLKDRRIIPEMGVRVSFLADRAAAVAADRTPIMIPASGIRNDGESSMVFVVNKGAVEKRAVTPGETVGSNRRILDGLQGGERIVLNPPSSLRDGDRVQAETGD